METTVLNTYEVTLDKGSAVIYRRHGKYRTHAYKFAITYRLMALMADNREYDIIGSRMDDVLETITDITESKVIGIKKIK